MSTNLPANVFKPATVAMLECISTSTVPRQCLPGGNPNAAMASETRTNPIEYSWTLSEESSFGRKGRLQVMAFRNYFLFI
jgi:hypothetical protein